MSNIRFLREEAGLTLRQLAEMTGLHYSMISQLENNEDMHISNRCVRVLAHALGATEEFIRAHDTRMLGVEAKPIDVFSHEGDSTLLFGAQYPDLKKLGVLSEKVENGVVTRTCDFTKMPSDSRGPLLNDALGLLRKMNEDQLGKAILMMREVILK